MPGEVRDRPAEREVTRLAGVLAGLAAQGARGATRVAVGGAGLWWRQALFVERTALRVLHDRLELASPPRTEPLTLQEVTPKDAMAELLERAVEQTAREGREAFFVSLIGELVPDEARILSVLSQRGSVALVHVDARLPGVTRSRVLENATLLGGRAALTVPDMARAYVSKLLTLGLVEVAGEDERLADDYEIVLAEREVREAMAQAGISKVPGRAIRRTLRLSALGEELWAACRPGP
jgi:hypothetical protein